MKKNKNIKRLNLLRQLLLLVGDLLLSYVRKVDAENQNHKKDIIKMRKEISEIDERIKENEELIHRARTMEKVI